ncbi:MAG: phage integrase N-terminal SAM-like domain-containing protein, partial [Deltaproteobacteria bacterium]|nr:phage integrase N-terminal SAM-like domain-containing protein [Deltaproteobacteria bacterium]
MTQLRCEMSKMMQLRDLSVHTQRSYLSAVSGLARHYNMSPDKISKTMVEDYLLYLKNVKKQASNGVGTIVSGLKFLY